MPVLPNGRRFDIPARRGAQLVKGTVESRKGSGAQIKQIPSTAFLNPVSQALQRRKGTSSFCLGRTSLA